MTKELKDLCLKVNFKLKQPVWYEITLVSFWNNGFAELWHNNSYPHIPLDIQYHVAKQLFTTNENIEGQQIVFLDNC